MSYLENAPSKTGNPSGGGRGNNPPSKLNLTGDSACPRRVIPQGPKNHGNFSMKIQKYQQQLLRTMRNKWPGMLLQLSRGGKHYKLMATFSGAEIQVAVAGSPRYLDAGTHAQSGTFREVAERAWYYP
ncbi:hypothetical protein [Burkholderia sp. 22PA0106]|uniref:hypothetical protein n=1 Tax=Burkholderia sp. 22PA0106 TaxID=3237371 RepID=UPI0039C2989F